MSLLSSRLLAQAVTALRQCQRGQGANVICVSEWARRGWSSARNAHDEAPSTSDSTDDDAPSGPGWMSGPRFNKPTKRVAEEWEAVDDPTSGLGTKWRSVLTGQETVPGAPKPDTWLQVVDKQTGLIYFWCRETGDTTALGEPKPGPYGRKRASQQGQEGEEDELLERHRAVDKPRRGAGAGAGAGTGAGAGGAGAGPSLVAMVKNPVVIGVLGLGIFGVAWEVLN